MFRAALSPFSVNKVILVGGVGSDPRIVEFDNGGKLADFPLATSRRYKDKEGNLVENTAWHKIQFRGDRVDSVANLIKKGAFIQVDGSIRYDTYTNKQGVEVHQTQIMGDSFTILAFPKRKDAEGEAEGKQGAEEDE
ncbi:hypothetical protein H4R21_001269 [Coemansia helicoidea]|uniref:Uncharacterized protein n=1 Tax=Coemansia helicoidea TaxID=1286919 RepID=A0ACC1LC36_9FUNG|nr:hypothetical protein H4R21_001269 [Coemansia helicoidea]